MHLFTYLYLQGEVQEVQKKQTRLSAAMQARYGLCFIHTDGGKCFLGLSSFFIVHSPQGPHNIIMYRLGVSVKCGLSFF